MGKPEGQRSTGGRDVANIKIHLSEVDCDAGDWLDLAQNKGSMTDFN